MKGDPTRQPPYLREPNFLREFSEARVRAQRVKARVYLEKGKAVFTFFMSPVEFGECLLFFAEFYITNGSKVT